MTEQLDQFTWSHLSKIIADGAGNTARQTVHAGNMEMLHKIRGFVQSGASFRMQPNGPIAIASQDTPNQAILECATSGTSGLPKLIRRSHLSWIKSFDINKAQFHLSPRDTYAVLGSLAHSISLYGVLEAAHIGADISVLAGLRPDRQLARLRKDSVTTLYATPTQLEGLIAVGSNNKLPNMRRVFIGGAALNQTRKTMCQAIFPNAKLTPFYGASETSFIAMADDQSPAGSVGQPYPGVEIAIRSDTGQKSDEISEIWVKSPYLFSGYSGPTNSDTKFHDGFVSVGEFGRRDDNGNLFVMGRKNRMVTISDQNVFPEAIEAFLSDHCTAIPLVVIPVPDQKRGHRLAVVATSNTHHNADLDVAIGLCRKTYGAHCAPKHVFYVETLPQLPSGKPDYAKITAWLADQL